MASLRGPAPIHHALLNEDSHTGITIQTLSPLKFDHGIPLLQTPKPGIPVPPNCTLPHLYSQLAKQGASMLVETLQKGLHVPPHQPQAQNEDDAKEQQLRHAPKITAVDKQVDWTAPNGARQVVLQERVLGSVWTHVWPPSDGDASKERRGTTRVLLEGLEEVAPAPSEEAPQRRGGSYRSRGEAGDEEGREMFVGKFDAEPGDGGAVVVQMGDGSRLRVWRIKTAGSVWKPARRALEKMGFGGTGLIEFVYI
jgi:methionyl-tRNA formyltransferase